MLLVWDANAWEDYLWWQVQDRKVVKRINTLIKDIDRNGNEGIGKPEALKHDFAGYGSRRITDEHATAGSFPRRQRVDRSGFEKRRSPTGS